MLWAGGLRDQIQSIGEGANWKKGHLCQGLEIGKRENMGEESGKILS